MRCMIEFYRQHSLVHSDSIKFHFTKHQINMNYRKKYIHLLTLYTYTINTDFARSFWCWHFKIFLIKVKCVLRVESDIFDSFVFVGS